MGNPAVEKFQAEQKRFVDAAVAVAAAVAAGNDRLVTLTKARPTHKHSQHSHSISPYRCMVHGWGFCRALIGSRIGWIISFWVFMLHTYFILCHIKVGILNSPYINDTWSCSEIAFVIADGGFNPFHCLTNVKKLHSYICNAWPGLVRIPFLCVTTIST